MSSQRRLVLVRHGETNWNVERRIQGQTDVPLNDTGHFQALAIVEDLVAFKPSTIVSSDLKRTMKTAEPLALRCGMSVVANPKLREISVGHWEGLLIEEAEQGFPEEYARWRSGEDIARGGGETRAETGRRVADALSAILRSTPEGETVIAFSHGVAIRVGLDTLREDGDVDLGEPAPHLDNAEWIAVDWLDRDVAHHPYEPPLRLANHAEGLAEEEAP